jgi:hypothetical protein
MLKCFVFCKNNQEFFEDTYYDSIPKDDDIDLDEVLENNSALNYQQRLLKMF